jgi:light-dependent protochlorophyllide reductase
MERDTALVTGGNSGIGFECARALAREGWHVLIASRNRDASAEAARRIASESGHDSVSELGLDLGSSASVRSLVTEIDARDVPLRALVCNAGLQVTDGPRLSPDGYEITFAVNHLGHFLLTHLLLDRLLANAPARIVVVSSGVHDPKLPSGMPDPAITDIETLATTGGPGGEKFSGYLAYVNSKLCNMWFTYELARRVEATGLSADARPLSIYAYEPGLVPGSGLAREAPAPVFFLWKRILPLVAAALNPVFPAISTMRKSGAALAALVRAPILERRSGSYFPSHSRWREARSSDDSYDLERARELWEASVTMSGLSSGDSPLLRS